MIQRASQRALANHTRLEEVFALVKRLRQKTEIPLCLMMYVNTLYVHGIANFFAQCREAGVDGVILPDVPLEEHAPFDKAARAEGVYPIYLVAPTSHERIRRIAQNASGFLYCVSSLGVTGKRSEYATDFDSFFGEIKAACTVPYAIGFGISGPGTGASDEPVCPRCHCGKRRSGTGGTVRQGFSSTGGRVCGQIGAGSQGKIKKKRKPPNRRQIAWLRVFRLFGRKIKAAVSAHSRWRQNCYS